jgi:HD-GYP domain-containing protein (c-di-GMP phosphodiesterase class II)
LENPRIKLLLVEDDEVDMMHFERFVRNNQLPYDHVWANSVHDAVNRLMSERFDVIVMDYMLGDGTALDLFCHIPPEVPSVVVTGAGDEDVAVKAIMSGASQYLIKDPDGHYLKTLPITVYNAIKSRRAEIALQHAYDELDLRVKERTAELVRTNVRLREEITQRERIQDELRSSLRSMEKMLEGTVTALASMAEKKDPYTAGHQQRVALLALAIGTSLGLSQERIKGMAIAAAMHDLGKIGVPGELLSKPGLINEHEYWIIKTHCQVGYDILRHIEFPWPVAEIVLQHHERVNGSGYPRGLRGSEILKEAAIVAVADVVEAMSSHRPYRPAVGLVEAVNEICGNKGVLYDEESVEVCCRLLENGFAF